MDLLGNTRSVARLERPVDRFVLCDHLVPLRVERF
jgi:hypothetical protein